MVYVDPNIKTKKELKERLAKGEEITVFQPNDAFGWKPRKNVVSVEGPHYPKPHSWYAEVEIDMATLRVLKVVS